MASKLRTANRTNQMIYWHMAEWVPAKIVWIKATIPGVKSNGEVPAENCSDIFLY